MRNYSYFTQMKTITTKIINQARLNGSMKFHVCRLASSTPFIEISNALREELRKVCDSKSAQGNADFKSEIKQLRAFSDELADLSSLNDVCESDAVLVKECEELVSDLNTRYQEFKHTSVLSRPGNRSSDCFIDLIAGAGGADSFDWVQMLVRMYSTWAKEEMEGYSAQLISATKNTDADSGYRNATLRITGPGCLGWLKADAGVHRLVRISPFDPQHKRHTSFAQVMVYPNVEADAASSGSSGKGSKGGAGGAGGSFISEGDVKMDTYRSSGAGGQSVNTTDSAVRLTHLPTGIVVTCQNERSQHQNKAFAMKVLRSKVAAVEAERLQRLKRDSMSGGGDGSWGQQIKSIVLNPYRMVKDHRTKWETGNVDGYLNGGHLLTESMRCQLEQEFLKSFTDT